MGRTEIGAVGQFVKPEPGIIHRLLAQIESDRQRKSTTLARHIDCRSSWWTCRRHSVRMDHCSEPQPSLMAIPKGVAMRHTPLLVLAVAALMTGNVHVSSAPGDSDAYRAGTDIGAFLCYARHSPIGGNK